MRTRLHPVETISAHRCLALLAFFLLFRGAIAAQPEEFRGFWVDAWGSDLWTSNGVTTVINDARLANANALVCQVRRRGDALYRISPLEPVCSDVESEFDPLAELIAKAHDTSGGKQRLEIHAWLVTYSAWHGTNTPPPGHPSVLHPEWLTRDSGALVLQSFDPGHPKLQQHTFDVVMNIVSNYDVDGINLDYIRYSALNEGYNFTAQNRYAAQTGRPIPPQPSDELWKQWRRDQVTALLRKIYISAIAIRPSIKVSCDSVTWAPAAVSDFGWTNSRPYNEVLQDWRAWMEEGIIDLNLPMTYFRQYDASQAREYGDWIQFILDHQYGRKAAIGPGIHLNSVEDAIRQMRATRLPSAHGNYGYGLCAYGFKQTNKDDIPRPVFLNALVRPSSFDSAEPVFAQPAECPSMPWRASPTKGHLKGFIYGLSITNPLDGAFFAIAGPNQRIGMSDGTGFYGSVDLAPGFYTIRAWAKNYPAITNSFTVTAGQVTTVDFVLEQSGLQTPPAVLVQPQAQTVLLGGDARFVVHAEGTAQLKYQWSREGGNLAGASSSTLLLTNVQLADAGGYRVVITNSYGMTTSAVAVLTAVSQPPTILTHPEGKSAIAGSKITLAVGATGALPLSYQWYLDGSPIASNSPTLVLPDIQPSQAGVYAVVVSNQFGIATSATATVSVQYSLDVRVNGSGSMSKSPHATSYPPGSVVRLSALPSTNSNFMEWSGDLSGNQNPRTISLTNNMTVIANFNDFLIVPDIIVDNADPESSFIGVWQSGTNDGKYSTDYRFALGSLVGISNAIFRPVIPVDGNYDVLIWYNQGPNRATNAPWTVCWEGGSETNFVNQQTNGSQWLKIASAKEFHAGTNGYVRLSNQIGVTDKVVMADAVKFIFVAPPFIVDPPQSQRVVAGQSATFMVSATGGENLYEWRKDGTNVSGSNLFWFQVASPRYSNAGLYDVVVSNVLGSVVSASAALEVIPPEIRHFSFESNDLSVLEMNWAAPETIVEASADLTNWVAIPSVLRSTNSLEFKDVETNSAERFYRTRLP